MVNVYNLHHFRNPDIQNSSLAETISDSRNSTKTIDWWVWKKEKTSTSSQSKLSKEQWIKVAWYYRDAIFKRRRNVTCHVTKHCYLTSSPFPADQEHHTDVSNIASASWELLKHTYGSPKIPVLSSLGVKISLKVPHTLRVMPNSAPPNWSSRVH